MTEKELRLISEAAADLESGNHLLYPRTEEQRAMIKRVCQVLGTPESDRTERQWEIYEQYRLCTDYEYWKLKNKEKYE